MIELCCWLAAVASYDRTVMCTKHEPDHGTAYMQADTGLCSNWHGLPALHLFFKSNPSHTVLRYLEHA